MHAKLGDVLCAQYVDLSFFRVVEDGDTSGCQSGKGIDATRAHIIPAWKLPPHSHGRMPLDFCLWDETERRALPKRAVEDERATAYEARLKLTAKRLSSAVIQNSLGKMKESLQALVDSEGGHTQLD